MGLLAGIRRLAGGRGAVAGSSMISAARIGAFGVDEPPPPFSRPSPEPVDLDDDLPWELREER